MTPIYRIRTKVFAVNQREFGALLGVSQGTISRWENGTLVPSSRHLAMIRDAARAQDKSLNDSWFFEPVEPKEIAHTLAPARERAGA